MNKSICVLLVGMFFVLPSPVLSQDKKTKTVRELVTASRKWKERDIAALVKAAEQGNSVAQNWLGEVYSRQNYNLAYVFADHAEAIRWFKLSAAQGNPIAKSNLANAFAQGLGTKKDFSMAMKLYGELAEYDCTIMSELANNFYTGTNGFPDDLSQAVSWWERITDTSSGCIDMWAEFNLARAYAFGGLRGVKQDVEKAYFWALVAKGRVETYGGSYPGSEGEMIKNVFALPLMQEQKERMQKRLKTFRDTASSSQKSRFLEVLDPRLDNMEEHIFLESSVSPVARKLIKDHEVFTNSNAYIFHYLSRKKELLPQVLLLAEQGDVQAQVTAAQFFWNTAHTSVQRDGKYIKEYPNALELSEKWWLKAAEAGNPVAQMKAIRIYLQDKNYEEAVRYANIQAGQNNQEALFLLGVLSFYGLGVEKDVGAALGYFTKADYPSAKYWQQAIEGDPRSQVIVGLDVWHKLLSFPDEEISFWMGCAMKGTEDAHFIGSDGSKVEAVIEWQKAIARLSPEQKRRVEERVSNCAYVKVSVP